MSARRIAGYALALAALFAVSPARAEVGLADACFDAESVGAELGQCAERAYVRPSDDTIVAMCEAGNEAEACGFGAQASSYQRFGDIAPDTLVWTCGADIAPGAWSGETPCPDGGTLIPKRDVVFSGLIVDGTGQVTLSWQRPTETVDDEPLPIEDIAGYVVWRGDQPRAEACAGERPLSRDDDTCYAESWIIENGAVSSRMFELELGEPTTLYFAIAAEHVNGELSGYSNEVAKTFVLELIDERVPGPPTSISVDVTMTCTTNTPGVSCQFTVE